MDRVVDGGLPRQAAPLQSVAYGGQRDPFLSEPEMNLPHALQLDELAKDQCERLANALVRIRLNSIGSVSDIANRNRGEQFAASSLLFERFVGP